MKHDKSLPEATVARLFIIMGQKEAESGQAGKYKARGVMAGNAIQTKASLVTTLFQDVAQTPASLVTARAALAAGALSGFEATVRDAQSAYLQAPLKTHNQDGSRKPSQWLRLPKSVWPSDWFDSQGQAKFWDPVVRLDKSHLWPPRIGGSLGCLRRQALET